MFTIGEFSKITGLTVKTLRFYHEEQLLLPALVDPETGYRYYEEQQIPTAHTIANLRSMDFPLGDIREIIRRGADEEHLLAALARHKETLEQKIKNYKSAVRSLDKFLADERKSQAMAHSAHQVVEKLLEPLLVAGIRMKGRYSDCSKGFAIICRTFGRHICGPPFLLHYDSEFREDDADYEVCVPLRRSKDAGDIVLRELPGGRALTLVHTGSYDALGRSYATILTHIKSQSYTVGMPTREVYLKGPGMIFKGNPNNYVTEIQMLVDEGAHGQ